MNNSYWVQTVPILKKSFTPLKEDLSCDVCIVGGGITGLSCAYYLSRLGYHVIVLEKDSLGSQTSGNTTAKITSQHGLFYNHLVTSFGTDFAKQYLEANEKAIQNIHEIIERENIDCDFTFQDNYVFTQEKKQIDAIKQEYQALTLLNFPAKYIENPSLPIKALAAIQFPKQAQFHPRKYMEGLVSAIIKYNGILYEQTKVKDVKKDKDFYTVYTSQHKIHSKHVILATKYPIINAPGFYFMKLHQEMSYLIAVETKKTLNGMYITSESPIISLRPLPGNKNILLIGGNDHKTGEKIDLTNRYTFLENIARTIDPNCNILAKWETEDAVSVDKVPYIGAFSTLTPHMYVATGFKKWGMTSSNIAATLLTDLIQGKPNPYQSTFLSTRFHPIQNRMDVKNMVKESTYSLLINKTIASPDTLEDIPLEDARMVEIDNEKIGVYKNAEGTLYAVKPICTHLGCELSFNNLSKTWDCPCHGSRYLYDGTYIYGPTLKDLTKVNLSSNETPSNNLT